MGDFIYDWIDILWLPIAFLTVHKKHRWWALAFVGASMLMMRLLSELMTHGGYDYGIMNLMDSHVHSRGLVTYSIFYILFLLMAHYSPRTEGIIFMAACISIFFIAMFTNVLVMVL